ncbi:hypothetical protein Pmani_006788 [Petrolisthes manimaculis]|uniref:Peptidase S1 domain-containing protein n=1 Tax=Petrolisthes manimaculis TaxID=1843537 RepID=A0AAE1Q9L9_9EUCA|nr:hypothetical protein Pmani_006788 [Petrolisthes manimaculis]
MYNDVTNQAYVKFLLPILKDVQRVHKSFESNEADPTKLLGDITLLIKSLVQKVVLPTLTVDPLEGNIEDTLDPKPYLGYLFEKEVEVLKENGYPVDQEKFLRERCIKFVTRLVHEMRHRLPTNVKILQKISLQSVNNALHCIKEPLVPLMELLQVHHDDADAIENQWRNLTLVKWNEVTQTVLFWREICFGGLAQDSCKGDSGGPLVLKELNPLLIGIVSRGLDKRCGLVGIPAVYTHVAAYRTWITQNIKA